MFYTDELPGRTVVLDQREYLWCSGTSYLGMSRNPVFIERVLEGIRRVGINWGSSRNNTLRLAIYEEAERVLAQWMGAPAALTVSSGMMAGQVLMKWLTFSQPGVLVLYAPNVHPALWADDFLPATESYETWFAELPERIRQSQAPEVVIVTDSVGSPHTRLVPFDWMNHLPTDARITVVVDDSHGLGVFSQGRGIYSQLSAPTNVRLLYVASLNKALSVPAGVLVGSVEVMEAIRHFPMFSGASPANPANLWAFTQSLELYQEAHQLLSQRVDQFVEELGPSIQLFHWLPAYPAFTTTQPGLHEYLREAGILTACFPYPGPNDPAITRLVITPLHEPSDISRMAAACRAYEVRASVASEQTEA
ncbi:aminotransferase class I/II-fold pyridoxal phosphate-dependent enzyme [Siphonobacter sp.]|uniref:aminotransferase class I/II-fold pyridoxal phosphate-dependent enzyme n=1 Tax=Siphonobacter sp. TaxID=1869184 RepID=UPI003B3AD379